MHPDPREYAEKNGLTPVKGVPPRVEKATKAREMFTDGRNFYSRDLDNHLGNAAFKGFNRRGNRIGTFDKDMRRIGG